MSLRRAGTVLIAIGLAACAGAAPADSGPTSDPEMTTTTVTTAAPVSTLPPYEGFEASTEPKGTLVVILGEEIPVYASPEDPEPAHVIPATTILGTTTVLTTTGPPVDGWVEVMLPIRPNGSTGWVVVEDIAMYVVDGRIEVSLEAPVAA